MKWRFQLASNRQLTIVCAYASTLVADETTKEQYYDLLDHTIHEVPRSDRLIVPGDFNARIGKNYWLREGVPGRHGIGRCNSSRLRLLTFCSEHHLTITKTRFQLRNSYKTTWQYPRSINWYLLDFILVRQCDVADVQVTRVTRGAVGDTDHRLVRSKHDYEWSHSVEELPAGPVWTSMLCRIFKREENCKPYIKRKYREDHLLAALQNNWLTNGKVSAMHLWMKLIKSWEPPRKRKEIDLMSKTTIYRYSSMNVTSYLYLLLGAPQGLVQSTPPFELRFRVN